MTCSLSIDIADKQSPASSENAVTTSEENILGLKKSQPRMENDKNLTGNYPEKKKWNSLANEEFYKQNSSFQFHCLTILNAFIFLLSYSIIS